MRVLDRLDQIADEPGALLLVGHQQEQLLELVDHQQQPGLFVGKQAQHRPQQIEIVTSPPLAEVHPRRLRSGTQQRDLHLLERMGTGPHLGDHPPVG